MEKNTYKILIVDDDEFLLDIYSTKFSEQGHTTFSAKGAQEALDVLAQHNDIDVIILDIVMPEMDGLTLLQKIRKENLATNNPVIAVLSNQGQASDIEKAKEYGIDGYIVKASSIPSEVLASVLEMAKKRYAAV
jgi:CheY-like chemotaxis protein